MLFNSIGFAVFLPIVFILYWFLNKTSLKYQNLFLLVVSYFFYSCWDWRFLFLLIFSTSLDYFTGIKMYESQSQKEKKVWLWISIIINLGFLGVFKYYNFFTDSVANALSLIGIQANIWTLKVILPVGISFYTFHGLSYVIDIYKDRIKPEKNVIDYSLFVSYFPLLVAGPIERATHLLPQIKEKRYFNYDKAVDGLRQILWGIFKKVVIADNCAEIVNRIFDAPQDFNGSTLFIGAVFFAFQIYGDFGGYSDIAIGSSKLFGIDLLKNFNYPYFSRDIAEFWRRWHISLSSWFKDYLYIPLGGSKGGNWSRIRNVFIIFLVSGFWHGANWTFIVWGFLNALYIMPSIIRRTNRTNIDTIASEKRVPSIKDFLSICFTFLLTVFAWIFFRAKSVADAFQYLKIIVSKSFFLAPKIKSNYFSSTILIVLILFLIVVEWIQREKNHGLEMSHSKDKSIYRWFLYLILFLIITVWGVATKTEFIYFAF